MKETVPVQVAVLVNTETVAFSALRVAREATAQADEAIDLAIATGQATTDLYTCICAARQCRKAAEDAERIALARDGNYNAALVALRVASRQAHEVDLALRRLRADLPVSLSYDAQDVPADVVVVSPANLPFRARIVEWVSTAPALPAPPEKYSG